MQQQCVRILKPRKPGTVLNTMAVVSQPSPYRRQLLKTAMMLSRENIDGVLFLSEDFLTQSEVTQISSGVDLMRCLERHGKLSPWNLSYLFYCLKEVGREDLAASLTEFHLQPPLQFTPPSFSVPRQMLGMKLGILHSKHSGYAEQMRILNHLTQNTSDLGGSMVSIVQGMIASNYPSPNTTDIRKILGDAVSNIAKMLNAAAMSSSHLATRSYSLASVYLLEVEANYKKLQNTVEGTKCSFPCCRMNMPTGAAAKACSFLADFFSELLGKQDIVEESMKLSKTLSCIEVLAPMPGYWLNTLQWLFAAIEGVISSSYDLQASEADLKSVVSKLAHVAHQDDAVTAILNGTNILKNPNPHPVTELQGAWHCPVILCAVPLLDILGSKSSSQREDWQTMKYNWALQSRTLVSGATHYMSCIIKGLSTALDHFREKILAMEVPLGVQGIIREIFNF